mmetsp:Transcript_9572/g.23497  ORF Transcript_9572/g.23497 Transcript_9572/m.23497 type:complete len:316 (+) Transcript_9572:156-1103(+)|eukprot:CAMPEP_0197177436 /NCGR_PEP_ID=MMETSP1423-20130617/3037_1 /TAXON_ID=476441 /ORGANISM="Pseudo-nitzschia heimii, Strain UNC1101" /LENGTH=315 /DNA_ID=CAMNT_0042626977 /DNA_START=87 /DNA_END=1034 /DNA_ORIENTATION=-
MFRKPKRKKAAGLRKRKTFDDDNDDDDGNEVREALKRAKEEHGGGKALSSSRSVAETVVADVDHNTKKAMMHTFEDSGRTINQKDLATATVQHHPKAMESISKSRDETTNNPSKPKRNKFLAGPIRAPTNIRTTCRFDYQPDICKDYKDTGFCGFGDSCIYLHDRGDTMNGWQLDKIWEDSQKSRKKRQEEELERLLSGADDDGNIQDGDNAATGPGVDGPDDDDGMPFACFLCRKAFDDPIVTSCGHYFNQGCLQKHFADQEGSHRNCPVCSRDTHGVMNQPTKLIAKKRKLMGRKATWQDFMDARGRTGKTNE